MWSQRRSIRWAVMCAALELLNYPDREDKNKSFALLQSQSDQLYVAQSGLIGEGLPTHKTRYNADAAPAPSNPARIKSR